MREETSAILQNRVNWGEKEKGKPESKAVGGNPTDHEKF